MKKAIVPLGIVILMAFGIFMYFNRFTIFHVTDMDGFVFETNDMATNLAGGLNDESPEIKFESVKISDNIYKSGKKYYIGEETKKNVVLDYPIVSEDDSSLLILFDTGFFVEETFVKTETFKNTILTNNNLYSGVTNQKLDEAAYTFVQLGNGLFINLQKLILQIDNKEYIIPMHSFIYFERSFLRYYYYANGVYRYKEIAPIKDYSDITVGEYTYDYYDFLIYLGVLERPDLKEEEIENEIEEPNIPGVGVGNVGAGTTTDSIQLPPPLLESNGAHFVDKEYVKPEVTFGNPKAGVYSWSGDLTVYDPAGRIYKKPTFEFKIDGQVYMRTTYARSMRIETVGLLPDTEYEVYAYYQYLNDKEQKMEVKIYEGSFRTKDTSELEMLQMEIGEIIPDVNSADINNIVLKNDGNSEVLKGLKSGTVKIVPNINLKLGLGNMNDLMGKKPTNYNTGSSLKSGTDYTGEIILYDVVGNELKITGNKFSFRTLKTPPIGSIKMEEFANNFTNAKVSVMLSNPDDITDDPNSYKYLVYDEHGQIVDEGPLKEPSNYKTIETKEISNLAPMTRYTIKVICNYLDAKKGWIYNYEIASEEIFTEDFAVLGHVPFDVEITNITSDYADINISMPAYDRQKTLYILMADDIPVKIINTENTDEVYEFEMSKMNDIEQNGLYRIPLKNEYETDKNILLNSDSKYMITINPYIKVGNTEKYEIPTTMTQSTFITNKKDVAIYYANGYVSHKYIDFDICIEDVDGALDITDDGEYNPKNVEVSFRKKSESVYEGGKSIKPRRSCTEVTSDENEMGTENSTETSIYNNFTRITEDGLNEKEEYYIIYKIFEYKMNRNDKNVQQGSDTSLLKDDDGNDVAIKPEGSKGNLKLISLTNQINYEVVTALSVGTSDNEEGTGTENAEGNEESDKNDESEDGEADVIDMNTVLSKNIFDIKNSTRWIYNGDDSDSGDTKELKLEENVVEFKVPKGYKTFSYYMPELKGQEYSISFNYNYTANGRTAYFVFDDVFTSIDDPTSGDNQIATISSSNAKNKQYLVHVCTQEQYEEDKTKAESERTCSAVQTGNYISFYIGKSINNSLTSVLTVSDLKIELGYPENGVVYSEFGKKPGDDSVYVDSYAGIFNIEFTDVLQKDKISEGDYPVDFYDPAWNYKYYVEYIAEGSELIDYLIEIPAVSEGEVLEIAEEYMERIVRQKLTANKNFKATIGVEVESNGWKKRHIIKTLDFSTDTETRTIKTRTEFVNMHPYGYYYVDLEDNLAEITCKYEDGELYKNDKSVNDGLCIDLTGYTYNRTFQGVIDFQGYRVQLEVNNGSYNTMFTTLGGGAIVKNLDLLIRFKESRNWSFPFSKGEEKPLGYNAVADVNNGLISNINVTFEYLLYSTDSTGTTMSHGTPQPREIQYAAISEEDTRLVPTYFKDTGFQSFTLITPTNNGIIENFAINMVDSVPILKNSGLVTITNNGVIKNGYVVGKNIISQFKNGNSKKLGVFAGTSSANSRISNVYTTVDIITEPIVYPEGFSIDYTSGSTVYQLTDFAQFTENQMTYIDKRVGTIVDEAKNAYLENILVGDPRLSYLDKWDYKYNSGRDLNVDPLVVTGTTVNIDNTYYTGNDNYKMTNNTKQIEPKVLYSKDFLDLVLNNDGLFDTYYAWNNDVYPPLNWPNYMPKQPSVPLPSESIKPKMELITVNKVEQDRDTIKEELKSWENVTNPEEDWFAIVEIGILNPAVKIGGRTQGEYEVVTIGIEGVNNEIKLEKTDNGHFEYAETDFVTSTGQRNINADSIATLKVAIKNEPGIYKKKYKVTDIVLKDSNEDYYACNVENVRKIDTQFDCDDLPSLELDLFFYINDYNQLQSRMNTHSLYNENYRLTNDIIVPEGQFIGYEKNGETHFSGVLDGNGNNIYSKIDDKTKEKELISNNCLIQNLSGTIKNINIPKYLIIASASKEKYAGLVCESNSGSVLDNIHISNLKSAAVLTDEYIDNADKITDDDELGTKAKEYFDVYYGALVARSNGTIISNSSVQNFVVDQQQLNSKKSYKGNLYIGGLVGLADSSDIKNSFARNVDFKLIKSSDIPEYGYEKLVAAGGIVGKLKSGNVENVYATGVINSMLGKIESGYGGLGGIAGYTTGFIRSAISKVNLYANSDDIGGIAGGTTNNSSYLSKTIVFGDILTLLSDGEYEKVDRTSGTKFQYSQNYAWYYQSINSIVTPNSTFEELLPSDDLKNPSLYETKTGFDGTNFSLSQKNYSLLVTDIEGVNHQVELSNILEEIDESGQLIRYFIKDEEKIIIKEEYATIPKILNSNTAEPLPNQELTLDEDGIDNQGDLIINYVATFKITNKPTPNYIKKEQPLEPLADDEKSKADYVEVNFAMQVAFNDLEINDLYFNITDMEAYYKSTEEMMVNDTPYIKAQLKPVSATKENGCTSDEGCYIVILKVKASLNKNYESYTISSIKYKRTGDTEYSNFITKIKMTIPFYGRIESLCDWQLIKKGTFQNFALINDLDFSKLSGIECDCDKTKPNMDLSFNKLVGNPLLDDNGNIIKDEDGNVVYPTIKNIEYPPGLKAGSSIINTINSEIRGINFYNIKLSTTSGGSKFGIINTLNGTMYGHQPNKTDEASIYMKFDKITLNAPYINWVGIIAKNQANQINYIRLNDITVKGGSRVGALIGESILKNKYNIYATNIDVSGKQYVGGIMGLEPYAGSNRYTSYVTITGVNVTGTSNQVGGAIGFGAGDYIVVTGTDGKRTIKGNSDVGGVSGHSRTYGTNYNIAKNLVVSGNTNVGGVFGKSLRNSYSQSIINEISGTKFVGGISGHYYDGSSHIYKATVAGAIITATGDDSRVGGIVGHVGTNTRIEDCQVGTYDPDVKVPNNEIRTTISGNRYVGGITGYLYYSTYVRRNIVHAKITGKYEVGGIAGRIENQSNGSTWHPSHELNGNVVANSYVKATNTTYFVGGAVGRTFKSITGGNNKNNVIIATVKAGNSNANPANLSQIGYIVGGSTYVNNITTKIKEEKEVDGEIVTVQKSVTTTYDYTRKFGDEFVGAKSIAGYSSNLYSTKAYEGNTLNGIKLSDASTQISDIYTKTNNKYNNISNLSTFDRTALETTSTYNSAYFTASGKLGTLNETIYFPYQNQGANYTFDFTKLDHEYAKKNGYKWDKINSEQIYNEIDYVWPETTNKASSSSEVYNTSFGQLPEFDVYAVDVDKINIEFKNIDLESSFIINDTRYQVNRKVFTFYYDFKEDFNIELLNGRNSKKILIKADEVQNGVSVIGDYYYYLEDGEIVSNDPQNIVISQNTSEILENEEEEVETESDTSSESQKSDEIVESERIESEEGNSSDSQGFDEIVESDQVAHVSNGLTVLSTGNANDVYISLEKAKTKKKIENATNLYEGKILLDNQYIYNIETGETTENYFENLTLAETIPLYNSSYAENNIQTYKNYSTINGEVINKQVFVKGEQIEIIESEGVNNVTNNVIIDSYNDKSFLLFLGTDGKIYSLKDEIKYPRNFKNINIKSINSNVVHDTNILFVRYQDGSYVAFNYLTGQILSEDKNKKMDLIEYVKQELALSGDSIKERKTNDSYLEAKKLVSELNKKTIEQVLNDEISDSPELYSRKYSVSYNPSTGEYHVYEIPTKSGLNDEKTLSNSLNIKLDALINSNPKLLKYYKGETYNKVNKISALIITSVIILGIVIATINLGRYLQKRRKLIS